MGEDPRSVAEKIERVRQARRHKFYLHDDRITLSHGSGGKATHNLIEGVFAQAFSNPLLDPLEDAAVFAAETAGHPPRWAFTTDSSVVAPLFFPGGNIGTLAVHGTVNDLAVMGAVPLYISASFILEEGFPVADLRRIVEAMVAAAQTAGVAIVTGDTKVVEHGKADGLYINTAGVGAIHVPWSISQTRAQPGDSVLLSGPIGDHGIAVMLAREALDIEVDVVSDTAPLNGLVQHLLDAVGPAVHCLKDPTRGGLATALNEIALASEVAIGIDEKAIPVRPGVRGACEILGLDPLTIANEGRLIAIVAAEAAEQALTVLRQHPLGAEAQIIGQVQDTPAAMVFVRTDIGGTRVLDMLVGDPLPRIC